MKALVKEGRSVALKTVPYPNLTDPRKVVVRVVRAGLCRTDVYAAEGRIKVADPLILGHEFAGVIDQVGGMVEGLKPGDRVAVNPIIPCGECRYCSEEKAEFCQNSDFLGVDQMGCFAEFIAVPAASVFKLPESMSLLAAAYIEPVAASLAVLKAGLYPHDTGLIYGSNRFSELLRKILMLDGFTNVTIFDESTGEVIDEGAYDFVIETYINTETLMNMVRAVRPGGKIVLKSRQHHPVSFSMTQILRKEPVFHFVNYGSFDDAICLLATNLLDITDLVDGVYPLEKYKSVINIAKQQETLKPFFAPWED